MRAPTHWLQSVDGSHSHNRDRLTKKKKKNEQERNLMLSF